MSAARPFKTQIHVTKEWTLGTDASDHMTATDTFGHGPF